jgi:exodeoxyribonuclease V alpha subunit
MVKSFPKYVQKTFIEEEISLNSNADQMKCDLYRVIFQSDDKYIVGKFDLSDHRRFTAIGRMVDPKVGCTYELDGEWVIHPTHGRQFKFNKCKALIPTSLDGILRYITHVTKWVGPVTGKRLVDAYNFKTLEVMKNDPERIANDIRGITKARAGEIQRQMRKNEDTESLIVDLEALVGGMGLRKSLPYEIAEKWKEKSVAVIMKDPYVLCELRNVGFLTADSIAVNRIKIPPDAIERKNAAIAYALQQNESNGNVWIAATELRDTVNDLLSCDASDQIILQIKSKVVAYEEGFVGTQVAAQNEKYVARKLLKMARR